MAVQWCSATSLHGWCHHPSPPLPFPALVSIVSQPRRIGCVSVRREVAVAAAAEAAPPEVEADTDMEEEGVECEEGCGGTGWLLCDFLISILCFSSGADDQPASLVIVVAGRVHLVPEMQGLQMHHISRKHRIMIDTGMHSKQIELEIF